jgi:nucleotide-binding universal stress UspA family protein
LVASTAERIIGRSHVPVLLAANPGTQPPAHVLAATDGSDISTMVDQWGERLSRQLSVPWTRLSVVATSVPTAPLAEALATNDVESAGRGQWITREIADETSNAPVVAFGEPGTEILAAAARYHSGVIVVGRRGTGWARRALFGSVTNEVLHGARCPVLVVVEPGRDRRDDEP